MSTAESIEHAQNYLENLTDRYRVLRDATIYSADLEYISLHQALADYSRQRQKLNTDTTKEIELLNRITSLINRFWLIYKTRENEKNTLNMYERHINSFLSPEVSLKDMVDRKKAYKAARKGYLWAVITRNKKHIAQKRETKRLLQEKIDTYNNSESM